MSNRLIVCFLEDNFF